MIYFLLLHCFLTLFSKRSNVLSCGLIGYVGTQPANLNILKLLFVQNQSRGEDSFGVYIGGRVYKTLDSAIEYLSKTALPNLDVPNGNYTIIGHTRKKSVGAVRKSNAHPFAFKFSEKDPKELEICENGQEEDFNFVGAHNGTLHNYYNLRRYYKLNSVDFDIDSKILLGAIFKKQNYSPLSYYTGGAALLFAENNKPNLLHAWKGAKNNVEERPLHYVPVRENRKIVGYYLSSEREALAVVCNETTIQSKYISEVGDNQVVHFNAQKKGEIRLRRTNVKRKELPITFGTTKTIPTNVNKYAGGTQSKMQLGTPLGVQTVFDSIHNFFKKNHNSGFILLNEEMKYIKSGHPIHGVYHVFNRQIILSGKGKKYKFFRGYLLKQDVDWSAMEDKFGHKSFFNSEIEPYVQTPIFSTYSKTLRYKRSLLDNSYTFPIVDLTITCKIGEPRKVLIGDIPDKKYFLDSEGKLIESLIEPKKNFPMILDEPVTRDSTAQQIQKEIDEELERLEREEQEAKDLADKVENTRMDVILDDYYIEKIVLSNHIEAFIGVYGEELKDLHDETDYFECLKTTLENE